MINRENGYSQKLWINNFKILYFEIILSKKKADSI